MTMLQPVPSLYSNTIPKQGTLINETGAVINPGTLLYINGVEAAGFTAGLADNSVAGAFAQFVAVNSAPDESAVVVAELDQVLTGILDTSAGAIGDPIYLSTAGLMTRTAPTGNVRVEIVGRILVVSATVGVVQLLPKSIVQSIGSNEITSGASSIGVGATITEYVANGAISIPATGPAMTVKTLGSGGALAMTLAQPSEGQDGVVMIITAETAQAHVVTAAGGDTAFNGGDNDTATFGGAIGDSIVLVATGGFWNVVSTKNVTLSDAS